MHELNSEVVRVIQETLVLFVYEVNDIVSSIIGEPHCEHVISGSVLIPFLPKMNIRRNPTNELVIII